MNSLILFLTTLQKTEWKFELLELKEDLQESMDVKVSRRLEWPKNCYNTIC
jgi:hypothetical protein